MVSYSTNADVQNVAYGATNSDLDTVCTIARDVATSIINATLGYKKDITNVPDVIHRACALLAAGIISTSPEDKVDENTYFKTGMKLLSLMGEEVEGGKQYNTIPIDGFGRYEDFNHDPTVPYY